MLKSFLTKFNEDNVFKNLYQNSKGLAKYNKLEINIFFPFLWKRRLINLDELKKSFQSTIGCAHLTVECKFPIHHFLDDEIFWCEYKLQFSQKKKINELRTQSKHFQGKQLFEMDFQGQGY